ncbi:MAG: HEPN domain-containing protein [Pseudomonadota bacterium]
MKSETVQKWLDRVEYDLDTAKALLQTRRYIYVVFMCQQCIEKCLKALLEYQGKGILPIHNLRRLGELADMIEELDEPTLAKFDFLSQYYISARYKEDVAQLSRGMNETVARDFVQFTEEVVQWLSQKMK